MPKIIFNTTFELYKATDEYLLELGTGSVNTYGYPGSWNVSLITNFTSLFDVTRVSTLLGQTRKVLCHVDLPYSHDILYPLAFQSPGASSFNGNLSAWDTSCATTMSTMVSAARPVL